MFLSEKIDSIREKERKKEMVNSIEGFDNNFQRTFVFKYSLF